MVEQSRKWWQLALLDEQVRGKTSVVKAEETSDPTENGVRVLLSNPGDCKKTSQKRTGLLR